MFKGTFDEVILLLHLILGPILFTKIRSPQSIKLMYLFQTDLKRFELLSSSAYEFIKYIGR